MRKNVITTALLLITICAVIFTSSSFSPAAEDRYPRHINAKTQATITKALDYLAKTQTEDGNWNSTTDAISYPCVMAALSGMAFLAHGDTPHARTLRGKHPPD